MKVLLVVCLAFAGVSCEAEADPYTIGQVLAGIPAAKTALDGQTRILTHTSYPNGVVAGPSVVYSRANAAYPVASAGYAYPSAAAGYAYPSATYGAYPSATYSAFSGYPTAYSAGIHHLGKREAEAEADAYTIGQVAAGLPYANAVATGHAHNPGYLAYTSSPSSAVRSVYGGYPAAVRSVYSGYPAAVGSVYSGYPAAVRSVQYSAGYPTYAYSAGIHHLGKREAEAEAEAEPWTIGQVAAGLPLLNAAAEGRAPGHIAYTSYNGLRVAGAPVYGGYPSAVRSVYSGYPAAVRSVYSGYPAAVRSVQYSAGYPTYANYGAYGSIYG